MLLDSAPLHKDKLSHTSPYLVIQLTSAWTPQYTYAGTLLKSSRYPDAQLRKQLINYDFHLIRSKDNQTPLFEQDSSHYLESILKKIIKIWNHPKGFRPQ